nr:hypothetical protein [uncultured organism]
MYQKLKTQIAAICFSLAITGIACIAHAKEKIMTTAIQHISVSINRKPQEVYTYAANPENLPKWAAGLAGAKIHREGDIWISDSPMGKVKIKFAAKNDFGVLDHDVTIPTGETTHNAFRVIPNNDGSEVVFSIVRNAKMSDEEFKKDTAQIKKDLEKLKLVLEAQRES